jgi:predicted enzyme related to lactoylglutathione lyase
MKMNPVVHFEMPDKNPKRVSKFYEKAFGWGMQYLPKMGKYVLATTSPVDKNQMHKKKGAINGGFFEKGGYGNIPHVVISVGNLEKHMEIVKKAGGKIQGKPMNIPGIGNFVMFKDSEGNRVGMLQPAKM